MIGDDYTLELYRTDGAWIKQIMVSTEIAEIEQYEKDNPCEDGYYYSIWVIKYDQKTGEEIDAFPFY